jgi:glycosyltransferase involved in cell wall biosynthesis
MRILLWSPRGAGLHYHGPGTAAYWLYRGAEELGVNVHLAHGFRGQEPAGGPFSACHRIWPSTAKAVDQMGFLAAAHLWLRRNARNYDVFHGLGGYEITVRPARWAQSLGLPAVVKITNSHINLSDKAGWRSVLRLPARRRQALRELDGVIAISSDIAKELASYGVPDSAIATIPNGVDTRTFVPCLDPAERRHIRREIGWPENERIVLFVGAVVPRKGLHDLVDALPGLPADTRLVLAGPRPDRSYLRRLKSSARASGAQDRLELMDFIPTPAALYRAADVFVLPSSNEGLSNSLLEAMASGLAVVCTAVSGTRDLVRDGRNGTITGSDASDLARAIRAYLDDPLRMRSHGVAARQTIEEGYGTAAVLRQHLSLFSRVAGPGSQRRRITAS